MMVFLVRRGPQARSLFASAIVAAPLALALAVAAIPAKAADISIVLDQASLLKLPERVATIIVGNPLIADASVQPGGLMVVTGKGYGMTNVLALDRAGSILMEKTVEVRGPGADVVVVFRGLERESYSCAPNCERRVTLGDSPAYFDAALGQAGSRNDKAQATGAATK
jgi:Flp pilus assembly secretin CpaC